MEKRGRGRPRKVQLQPPDLAQNMPNSSNKKEVTPEFFKIYIPELASQVMRIPPDFVERIGGNVQTTYTLKRPKRETSWQVDTNITDDDWYFVKGWPQFVEDNSLLDGDFMTFDLVGKSKFCVTIFSPNGCLKGVANDYTIISSDDETSSESEASERRIASKRKRSVGSVNGKPYFSVVMGKSKCMTLPKQFWDSYIRKKVKDGSTEATLWVGNDAWTVNMKVVVDRVILAAGYTKFIKNNSLQLGTKCTFQLIETNPFAFTVTFSN